MVVVVAAAASTRPRPRPRPRWRQGGLRGFYAGGVLSGPSRHRGESQGTFGWERWGGGGGGGGGGVGGCNRIAESVKVMSTDSVTVDMSTLATIEG